MSENSTECIVGILEDATKLIKNVKLHVVSNNHDLNELKKKLKKIQDIAGDAPSLGGTLFSIDEVERLNEAISKIHVILEETDLEITSE